MFRYICIEGNIGSGKTSLAKKLANHLQAEFIGEEFEENPFLPLFYQEPQRYSFSLEFSFLLDRARQMIALRDRMQSGLYVSDYYIEKCRYFAQQNLSAAQYEEFEKSYPAIAALVPAPDLLVFLHLPTDSLRENIKSRGRSFEQNISHAYLQSVSQTYLAESKKQRPFSVLNFHIEQPSVQSYDQLFHELSVYIKRPSSVASLSMTIN